MFDSMLVLALTIASIGAGLMAGVYFAFSWELRGQTTV
jgi:uncharacterized membrane protein